MNPEGRIKFLAGKNVLYVNSKFLESDIQYIREHGVKHLMLLISCGYELNNVDWLSEVGDIIESIILTPPKKSVFSFTGLRNCKCLSDLKINNCRRDVIDLSNINSLTSLSVEDYRYVIGLETLSNLETLGMRSPPERLLTVDFFSHFKKLRHLGIVQKGLPEGLEFLIGSSISDLFIAFCRRLSLRGLSSLNLTKLKISNCKNVEHIDEIFRATTLRRLELVDSVKIDSPRSLDPLIDLDVVTLLGSSCFVDGNLDPLKGRLTHLGIDDKRHYNVKYDKFKELYLRKAHQ